MRDFDFHEFVSIITPGIVLMVCMDSACPAIRTSVAWSTLSTSEAILLLLLAYPIGHLVQGIGNVLEKQWWKLFQGMPTDWIRQGSAKYLSPTYSLRLESLLTEFLPPGSFSGFAKTSKHEWGCIVREIYACLLSSGKTEYVDRHNGNYGLSRGLAAAFLVSGIVALLYGQWVVLAITVLGLVLAVWRMHRFGIHYAQTLFIDFIRCRSDQGKGGES